MHTFALSLGAVRAALVACALLSAVVAAAEPRWAELNREARQAVSAGDYPKLRTTLAELAPLMPGNVRIAYNTTAAAAHLGDITAAFAGLDALCNMGLVFDLASDADFDSLHGTPRYDAALQCMKRNEQPVTHAQLVARARRAGSAARRHRLRSDVATAVRQQHSQEQDHRFERAAVREHRSAGAGARGRRQTPHAMGHDRLVAAMRELSCERRATKRMDRSITTLLAFDIDSQRMTRRIDSPIPGCSAT